MFLEAVLTTCVLTLAAPPEGAAPAALNATHDAPTGRTTVVFDCPEAGHWHYVLRSKSPIDATNFKNASVSASRLGSKEKELTLVASENGTFYYALAHSDELGGKLSFEKASGAVAESDRTPPAPPQPRFGYRSGKVVIEWNSPSLRNPEKIARFDVYRSASADADGSVIAALPKIRDRRQSFEDRSWDGSNAFYHVRAVDASGNASAPSMRFHASRTPNLTLERGERVSLNPSLATSKMYPKVGEKVNFSARIANSGAVASKPCRVTVRSGEKMLLDTEFAPLEPASERVVEWSFTPEKVGEYEMALAVDPANTSGDSDASDNTLSIKAGAVEKDVYFIWYGDVRQLPFSNSGQCLPDFIAEWRRRGAYAMAGTGAGPKMLPVYEKLAKSGYDGFSVDEIFMFTEMAQHVVKQLPEFRKNNPRTLVCVWTIGEDTTPEVAALVKDGTIDFLMFEVYVKPGEDVAPLRKAVENLRKRGILEKSLMGLVTDRTWNNWAGPKEQAASVVSQMRLVRELAPEMPGFAFWSANTQPGVAEAADAECYKLFVLNQRENKKSE